MERILIVGLIFIWFGGNFAQVQPTEQYFLIGENLQLRPPSGISKIITRVQWRHNDNIVAEWSEGDAKVDTYGDFKGRTDLDTSTGILRIRNMTKAEAGEYTIEINNIRLDGKYVVKSIKAVPEPNVWVKPKNKVENQRECACEGIVEGAEPVTYLWNTGPDRSWVESDRKIVIHDNETTRLIETFSCKMQNPVSEKESKPGENPFYQAAGNKALWALVLIPIFIVLVGGLVFWKRAAIKSYLCPGEERATRNGAANKVKDKSNVPLNSTENAPPPSPTA